MPGLKYRVDLSQEEREELCRLIRKGNGPARKLARARILLKADEGCSDAEVAGALYVGSATVGRVRQRFWLFRAFGES